jgi:hypothetical protein
MTGDLGGRVALADGIRYQATTALAFSGIFHHLVSAVGMAADRRHDRQGHLADDRLEWPGALASVLVLQPYTARRSRFHTVHNNWPHHRLRVRA